MCKKKLYCLFFALFFFIELYAQDLSKDKAQYFTVKNGLPDATIVSLIQDEDGFLWIATTNGLSRYDGSEFKNYFHTADSNSLPGNDVHQIVNLSDHRLLISTKTGLGILNTQTGHFKNLLIHSSEKMFPFENNFTKIACDQYGNIWAGSQTCLYRLDSNLAVLQTFRGFDENDLGKEKLTYVSDIKILPGKHVFFYLLGKQGGAFFTYDNNTKKIIRINDLLQTSLRFSGRNIYRDFCFDSTGNIFFIKYLVDSIFFYNTRLQKLSAYKMGNTIAPEQIFYSSKLMFIKNNLLACVLSNGGLLYWKNISPKNDSVDLAHSSTTLIDEDIFCMLNDQQDNLWIGTGTGLYKFASSARDLYKKDLTDLNPLVSHNNVITKIYHYQNALFLCTSDNGLYFNENNSWRHITFNNNPDLQTVWNVQQITNDTFWVATQAGVFWLDKLKNKYGPVQWPAGFSWMNQLPVTTIFIDSNNLVWIGLGIGNGVAAYDLNTKKIKVFTNKSTNSFPLRYPTCITEDENSNLWMGGNEGVGLVEWERKNNRFILYTPSYNSTFENGVINDIYADKNGMIWIASQSGLVQFSIAQKKFAKPGNTEFSSREILSLGNDQANNIWIGANNGLIYFNSKNNSFINLNNFYTAEEDPVTAVSYNIIDKKIYFASGNSFYSIPVNQWLQQKYQSRLFITAVSSSGKELDRTADIYLPNQNNNINISFTAVDLTAGNDTRYFYRIDGITKDWIDLGNTRTINFSNLSSGKYTFHAKARSTNGLWTANEAILSFTIEAPFWKTWWFAFSCIVCAAIIVYSIYRYRINQLMHLQQVRSRIAKDLHDDIGSALTNINILTTLTHSTIQEPEKAGNFLHRITEEVTGSSQSLDDIVWSINTGNDSFDQVVARMHRFAAEVFEAANIQYQVVFDEKLADKKLQMEQRRDVYLIFKEVINNIYKHANASVATIELKAEKNHFSIIISDNGKGFDTDSPTSRNGIKNIMSRTEKWKGAFNIYSSAGDGTKIIVKMPVFI